MEIIGWAQQQAFVRILSAKRMALDTLKLLASVRIRRRRPFALIAGMARSGTTWVGELINHDGRFREIFEPFHCHYVEVARSFLYHQYIHPSEARPDLAKAAKIILDGRLQSGWTHRTPKRRFGVPKPYLIKAVRANLMLGWLHRLRPAMPIVIVLRHPLAVTSSWLRLGWGVQSGGTETDFESVRSQDRLRADYPTISSTLPEINPDNNFEVTVFLWGTFALVSLDQVRSSAYVLRYEELVRNTEIEAKRLFDFLGLDFDSQRVLAASEKVSASDYLKRGKASMSERLEAWRSDFDERQVRRAREILEGLGVGGIYEF